MRIILIGAILSLISCKTLDTSKSYENLAQGLEQVSIIEPYTGLNWGESYDDVVNLVYENRKNIFLNDRERGLIVYYRQNRKTFLYFKENKFYKVTREIDMNEYQDVNEVYYNHVSTFESVLGEGLKDTRDGNPYTFWMNDDIYSFVILRHVENGITISIQKGENAN